jgi:hypothetical protein
VKVGTDLLTEHYQKTFEVTLAVWEQRNRTFLVLLAVVGGATLLTFNVSQAQPLLVDLIAKTLSVENADRQKELRASFPYGLIQSILLMVVLYLTLVLYHRTTFIIRSYRYLEALEREIRSGMELSADSVAFTREGGFYWNQRPFLSKAVGASYVGMLGLLLVAFLGMRIFTDFSSGNVWFAVVDVVLAMPTLLFFSAYALSSVYIKNITRLFARGRDT